ncbi:DEAD-box ATP-dependent RNA helicase 28 [Glycine soja]|uniref:DEAD-box ATP-dependent RNA helicase 28 n=1 Tax=Glycine soja TaxID=3848 RepID=A0A445IZ74_GLYSO|nr:DEAD-box ATP-dependent RNA helicase 28 [Glycine soja]
MLTTFSTRHVRRYMEKNEETTMEEKAACIPLALSGRDICGSAITGSRKTAAFALPTLERLLFRPKRMRAIRVLILTPTRESWQSSKVHSMIEKLAQFTDIRCCLVVGGLSTKVQEAALRTMPDIVVATPGRMNMIDHLRNAMSVDLDDLAVLIHDEADRLLELGFSAEIQELPLRLSADPSTKRPATLTEEVVRIRRMSEVNQEAVLLSMCSKTFTSKVIIFSGTKQPANRLKIIFGLAGLKASELHGNLTQAQQRLEALEQFRKQQVDFLVATNVTARGLDIIGVQIVINLACPRDLTSYVHRVGRTARAGREGYAVTFVTDNDRSLLKAIAKRAGSKLKSRIVAEQSIHKWSHIIEQMEDQISEVLHEEREERVLRKAEMEATKVLGFCEKRKSYDAKCFSLSADIISKFSTAENMIAHREEIFSRPKRTWHPWIRVASSGKEVISAEQAEDLRMKEKRKREREKHLPRKKRRKLEAAREMEEEEDDKQVETKGGNKKEKGGMSLVDLAYRRAKAVKAVKKALDSGKIVEKNKMKSNNNSRKTPSRTEEMRELFQTDMKDKKSKRRGVGGGKKSKSSLKSKSRYQLKILSLFRN